MLRPVGSGGVGPRGTGPQARRVTLPAEGPAQVSDTAVSVLSPSGPIGSSKAPSWRAVLAPYARPDLGRSLLDIVTSVVTYLGLLVAMYFLLDVSYWLVLAVSVPAAGFLVRTYIVFHDCPRQLPAVEQGERLARRHVRAARLHAPF